MATQITFTDDVLSVSSATNADASITWYVYDRLVAGVRAVYVRRDAGLGLEAEQQILVEGAYPKIAFDSTTSKWVILYTLYENVFYITFNEAEVPSLQPPQLGDNVTDHERTGAVTDDGDIGGQRTLGDRIKSFGQLGIRKVDAYNGPNFPASVAIVASVTPGQLAVRWTFAPSTFGSTPPTELVAGFLVYRELEQISGLIPFSGNFSTVYDFDIVPTPGNYYVKVVYYKGPNSTQLDEKQRIPKPGDRLRGSGADIGDVILGNILLGHLGQGSRSSKLLRVVDARPVTIIRQDNFVRPELGRSQQPGYEELGNFSPVTAEAPTDNFVRPELGRGRKLSLSQTGYGSVIIT